MEGSNFSVNSLIFPLDFTNINFKIESFKYFIIV